MLRRFLVPATAAGDLDPETPGRPWPSSRATAWPRRPSSWPCSTPGCGPGERLAGHLGATRDRVPAGVSVGIMDSCRSCWTPWPATDQGYLRIKLKIEPGWDLGPVAAVRERFGDDLLLQVDANAAYTLADADHLAGLDRPGCC